jgi:ABC-2 type transport system permease protein
VDSPLVSTWRAFWGATVLGWEISSSWTQPLIFFVYSVLKPLSAAFILVVMYSVIRRGSVGDYLAFVVVGSAFWAFVQQGLAEFAKGISEDRGWFRTLKYVMMSPHHLYLFLTGRALARLATGLASVAIVLTVATVALRLPIDPGRIDYPLLLAGCALAAITIVAMGAAYSIMLLMARDSYGFADVGAQSIYLLSGAIFPIAVLPGPLAALAAINPLTYWMELTRRALLGPRALLMFPGLNSSNVLLRLALCAAGTVLLAHLVFTWADRRARRRGYYDREIVF